MLSRIAFGVPRFSMTSERRSLSTRRRSFPKFARARRAEITIVPFLLKEVLAATKSPFQTFQLYSSDYARVKQHSVPRCYLHLGSKTIPQRAATFNNVEFFEIRGRLGVVMRS